MCLCFILNLNICKFYFFKYTTKAFVLYLYKNIFVKYLFFSLSLSLHLFDMDLKVKPQPNHLLLLFFLLAQSPFFLYENLYRKIQTVRAQKIYINPQ